MRRIIEMFSFSGFAKRAKFLQFIPLAIILWFLAAYIDEEYLAPNLCNINEDWICYLPGEVREGFTLDKLMGVFLLIPFASVIVRRLHDHGLSGWLALLAVPAIGLLASFLYAPEYNETWYLTIAALVCGLPLLYWMLKKGKLA